MTEEPGNTPQFADLVALAAEIVAAYVGNNPVAAADLPDLIRTIHLSLCDLVTDAPALPERVRPRPAVPVRKSIGEDFIICLEDGKKFKSLKRHLRARYDMTPEQYREKWGLAADYPMVAPGYSRQRSSLARQSGLGRTDKS